MNRIAKFIIPIISALAFLACGSSYPEKKTPHTYVVKRETLHNTLFFTGNIQPLFETVLSSPMDATLETMNFQYGQLVKKNDVVMTLNSFELQKQFNDTLTEYLKAKDSYAITQAKFIGTEDLWKAGLIAKNNFIGEKSGLAIARLTLMQTSRKLTELLEKTDEGNTMDLSNLNITEFDKVKQALNSNHNRIHLKTSTGGIMLYPPKSGDDKGAQISIGSTLKAAQPIAIIGDLSGIRVNIDIPEIDIDKVKPGMKARITGIALGKQVLDGELVSVNRQASAGNGNGLPSFSAVVEVTKLTPTQQSWIKVGMSASIQLLVESESQLLLPIAAVRQEKGISIVSVQQKNGSLKNTKVSTGTSLSDRVMIESGLKEGDVVVYG